ncbi:MAG: phage holin family protein [Candidatus Competibacter sp.]|nr:phage holin family protein [Candidatus Competibacter sp.]
MDSSNAVQDIASSQAPSNPPGRPPGVLKETGSLIKDFGELLQDHAKLAVLETKRVGGSAVALVAYGVGALIFASIAWLVLIAAVVLFLSERGYMMASTASALVMVVHLVVAFIFYKKMMGQRERMNFSATVRSFKATLSELKGAEKP